MKKHILWGLALFFVTPHLTAQDEALPSNWKKEGKIGLNLSQSHLSNWAAGGQSALNTLGLFSYKANYAKDKYQWDNFLDLALGYSVIGTSKPIKTDDRIEFSSQFGLKATEQLLYSLGFSFKSQFANGFDYANDSTHPISGLLAPGYFTLGVGMDWKPSEHFTISLAPLTGRVTVVTKEELSEAGAFGVEPGNTARFELGAKMVARLSKEIAKNIEIGTKLELFTDYLKNPQNIDVDWQAALTMKVNSWLNANIATHLIYDDDIMIMDKDGNIGPRTQFKEVFSLGLSYTF